ncbi:MAG TPA: DUF3105 domain-containing protein [Herpetosiphon sp.]|uniref:DUF3105 domain-containing protein n=1 Tax=Herpetosiphon aurantiacus (strain ATCC 23779 / DSM 785 / 114-95) TaxID=316274 RepID=A9B2P3_HERA2|nr:DUF3105 domain-containing protein [Herpetosiphon sp.]ABX05494.1 hypothetical protein Haur_2856 [Herpetosiphon aurantiacus DSM 785]HBW52876.1 DUF3105 domain-containing protein [Herpetosiphon sp.]
MEPTNWQREVEQALAQNDHNRAKQLLAAVIRQNVHEREAWRILASIVNDPAQQAECLRRIAAIDAATPTVIKPIKPIAAVAPSTELPSDPSTSPTTPLVAVQDTPNFTPSSIQTEPLFDSQASFTLPANYSMGQATQKLDQPMPQPARSLPKMLMLIGASLCGLGLLLLLGLQFWPLLNDINSTPASEQPLLAVVELTIVRSGVGQVPMTDQAMVYFEIENPSDQALYNIPYTMTLTSQFDKVLKNTNTIELLLPKQKIVVVDGIFTGDSFRAKSVEISLGQGYPITIDQPIPQVEALTPTTFGMPFRGRLQESWGYEYPTYHVSAIATDSGVVTSTLVSMLFYDTNDQIIGAGSGYIDYINKKTSLPNTRRGETMVYPIIWGTSEVDRVEIVPAFTLATFSQQPPIKPKKAEIDQMWLGEYIPEVDPPYHVQGIVEYPTLPPTSGYHAMVPAEWGHYDNFITDEAMVHNLEHGAVIIFYNPQLITANELGQLEATFENLYQREHHTILQKRFDLDATVAMTAWEYRLMLRDNVNLDAVNTFFSEHIARGPECVNLRCPN